MAPPRRRRPQSSRVSGSEAQERAAGVVHLRKFIPAEVAGGGEAKKMDAMDGAMGDEEVVELRMAGSTALRLGRESTAQERSARVSHIGPQTDRHNDI
jgi:hypothetical protein